MQPRILSLSLVFFVVATAQSAEPWSRHTIDGSFRGADGVRLADFNDDGLPDIVTPWEESGVIRLYLNPGPGRSGHHWPAVTVGHTASPEDAVPFDVDGDGRLDIVSCHEGKAKQVLVHFNAAAKSKTSDLLKESTWKTAEFKQLRGEQWMFAAPIKVNGVGSALALGSKGAGGSITLLVRPHQSPGDLSRWRSIRLREAGWIMSIRIVDMDSDGDDDIVFSDRKGPRRRVGWLEQPDDWVRLEAENHTAGWIEHTIGGEENEVMFIDVVQGDTDDSAPMKVLVATRNSIWIEFRRDSNSWVPHPAPNPPAVSHGKAIAKVGELLVMTGNTHSGGKKDVPGIWSKRGAASWQPISSSQRAKFDRIELIDLNGDGAVDVLTCEERQNFGVVWYENPGH